MSCPGGCIGGGGQPKAQEREAAWLRMQGLYSIDERAVKRRSHENAEVLLAYQVRSAWGVQGVSQCSVFRSL